MNKKNIIITIAALLILVAFVIYAKGLQIKILILSRRIRQRLK